MNKNLAIDVAFYGLVATGWISFIAGVDWVMLVALIAYVPVLALKVTRR